MIEIVESTEIGGFLLRLAPALINIILGLYVLIRFPRRYITDIFALLLFTAATWQFALALMYVSGDRGAAIFWEVVLSPLWMYTAPLTFHFALLLTSKFTPQKRRISYLTYLVTFILVPLFIIANTTGHYVVNPTIKASLPLLSAIGVGIWMQGLLIVSFVVLISQLVKTNKGSKRYYKLLLISGGLITVVIISLITDLIIPLFTGGEVMSFTSFAMLLFTAASFTALKRFELFQGEEMVDKGMLLSSVSDLVIGVNKYNEIIYINQPVLEKLGYEEHELLGQPLKTIIAKNCPNYKSVNEVTNNLSEILYEVECIFQVKTGEVISVMVSLSPIQNNKRTEGSLIIARDMSALKSAFERIRTSEKKFRQIVENSKDGTLFISSESKIIYASPPVSSILGYSLDEIINKNFLEIVSPDSAIDAEGILELVKQPDSNETVDPYYVQACKKDGTVIWLECNCKNELNDEDIKAIVIVFRDVTERENYEQDLLQKNEALRKLNREMDMFMYSVSHDIRSPVASILGLISLADTEIKDAKASGYLEMIQKAARKLDKYTKEIIHYSENIKNPILPEPIQLGQVVESVIAEIERNYKFADVDIELDVFNDPLIVIDNARLQVILKHLLLNAVQYQRINEPRKYVKVETELTDGWLNVVIIDNGEGIEENKLNDIFDLFTRFSYRSKGSGIGLYMVKEILNKLDGEIYVRSVRGQGSIFRFSVPCLSLADTNKVQSGISGSQRK